MARTPHVVVVGAGVGGLVAAALLAQRGLEVTVVEMADGPGGKMRPLAVDGAEVDAGPTVLTMRWVFDELLAELHAGADEWPALQPLQVLARHAWAGDAAHLDLFAERERSADAIARFSSPAEAARFVAFCDEAARVYQTLEGPHIRSSRPSVAQMIGDLGMRGLATLCALGPFSTLAGALARRFRDPRLAQLFGRYATYCGASPWQAPSTLMLVAHVEQQGVYSVAGGMAALARALCALGQRRGVRFSWRTACREIEVHGGRVGAVRLGGEHEGQRLAADAVVFNGDAGALAVLLPDNSTHSLAGGAARAARRDVQAPGARSRSLSAITWALHAPPGAANETGAAAAGGAAGAFPLERHNVFFEHDYASEFDDIFHARRLPRHGTVYLCAQDRPAAPGPAGRRERFLALVNAPAVGSDAGRDTDPDCAGALASPEIEACQRRCQALLQRCGVDLPLAPGPTSVRRTPRHFASLFPGSGGALYGPATHGWLALFKRSGAATALPGLYLAGGSVHPGPGVPMAAMSGRLAAATLAAHLASTRRSSRVHICGGTSMPSATTVATR
jgi:1-hydroxycarotenoid 3,4-desaturase